MKKKINLGFHRGNTRIWMEGYWLKELGFHKGARYNILEWGTMSGFTLRIHPEGKRIVSGKGDKPIIDINNKLASKYFPSDWHTEAYVSKGSYSGYHDINLEVTKVKVAEFATDAGLKNYDAALPQGWVDDQSKNPDFPGPQHFVWSYDAYKFGAPEPISPGGQRYFEGLVE